MIRSQLITRVRPAGSMRSFRHPFVMRWPLRVRGIDLPEIPEPNGQPRPAHSPIAKGASGNIRLEIAENKLTGVSTVLVGMAGGKRASAESLNQETAIDGACAAYDDLEETRIGRPAITAQDKAEVAALRTQIEPVGALSALARRR